MKMKFNKEKFVSGCKVVGVFTLAGIVGIGKIFLDSGRQTTTFRSDSTFFDYANFVYGSYDNAIKAIMDSNMWSDDKRKAVSAVKRDEEKEYYSSIISICNSRMWSDDKLKTIQDLGV